MKKRILLIVLSVVLALSAFAFAGCQPEGQRDLAKVTVILGEETYNVETKAETLHDLLIEMKEEGVISMYEFSGTDLTVYVTKIGELEVSEANQYIALFHTIDDPVLQWLEGGTKTINGVEYFYSSAGVAVLPINDGAIYYFELATF